MILITLMLMCFNATTYAQSDNVASEIVSDYDFSTFTINGLVMAECEYSEQDIITAFGEPDSVEYGEFGYSYNYKCGEVYSSDKGDYARVCDYDAIMEGVIFYDSDNVDLAGGTATVLIDGLEPGTEYVCYFCAYDRYGNYESSSKLIFTTAYY